MIHRNYSLREKKKKKIRILGKKRCLPLEFSATKENRGGEEENPLEEGEDLRRLSRSTKIEAEKKRKKEREKERVSKFAPLVFVAKGTRARSVDQSIRVRLDASPP